jgi:hypothetical protein
METGDAKAGGRALLVRAELGALSSRKLSVLSRVCVGQSQRVSLSPRGLVPPTTWCCACCTAAWGRS